MNVQRTIKQLSPAQLRRLSMAESAVLLSFLPKQSELDPVRRQLVQRLSRQLTIDWIETGPLEEVFAVLSALWQSDPALVSGEELAAAVQRLIRCEVTTGGPYRAGTQPELIANLHIARFMRLAAQPLPNVETFLRQSMSENALGANPLDLGTLYLLTQICEQQPLVPDASRPQTSFDTIIAAFIPDDALPPEPQSTELRQQDIKHATLQLFADLAEPLRSTAIAFTEQLFEIDKPQKEIALLPYFFGQSLKVPPKVPDEYYKTLGVASVCFWTACIIYDDFLDDEGMPAQLPVAHVALRASLEHFRQACLAPSFQRAIERAYTQVDEANAWEMANCRFARQGDELTINALPQYGNGGKLAERSYGHILAPVAILTQAGAEDSKVRLVQSGFHHYLIARQLNDDLHDWQDDFRAGHASPVVTAILRDLRLKPGTYHPDKLLPLMQKRFRGTTMPKICQLTLRHLAHSRKAFAQSQLLRADNDIDIFLDIIEKTVQQSLDVQAKSQAFLQKYQANSLL